MQHIRFPFSHPHQPANQTQSASLHEFIYVYIFSAGAKSIWIKQPAFKASWMIQFHWFSFIHWQHTFNISTWLRAVFSYRMLPFFFTPKIFHTKLNGEIAMLKFSCSCTEYHSIMRWCHNITCKHKFSFDNKWKLIDLLAVANQKTSNSTCILRILFSDIMRTSVFTSGYVDTDLNSFSWNHDVLCLIWLGQWIWRKSSCK